MSKVYSPQVITANHLLSGDVIYFTADDQWCLTHAEAELILAADLAKQRLAAAQQHTKVAVDPYLADARLNADGVPEPVHFREIFRTRGPSNYPHGKQVDI